MPEHGLSIQQLQAIRAILALYAEKIERVGLFGSRAAGTARPNSDIDLVLYGSLDEAAVDRIHTLFGESSLALKVDVNAYDLIAYPPLKAHIDSVMQPLFLKTDLLTNSPTLTSKEQKNAKSTD